MARDLIALFLRSLENDYQYRMREDALATANHLGFRLTVLEAHDDPERQAAQIAAVAHGTESAHLAAVMVSPVLDEILREPAWAVGAAGVGWVLLNRAAGYVDRLRDDFPNLPIFSVTADQIEIGRLQGRQLKAALARGGHVVCVLGRPDTSSAKRRLEGLREEIDGGPWTLTLVDGDWTSDGARLAVADWLEGEGRGTPAAMICAQNDDMAMGAQLSLHAAAARFGDPKLGATPVIGCDGSPDFGQRLVREGRLLATVEVPSGSGLAMEWIARSRAGGTRPPASVVLPVRSVPARQQIAAARNP
ncbi:MAG TPA: substrate-binding domain-containing protein [Polyangia bacterium]|jgi:ABC-type sugar transport system substrate-binding protein